MKLSLVLCCWNTAHLLKRSIYTYCQQDFPKNDWELIIVDDNSEDDVKEAIKFAEDKINIRYVRIDHPFGMRGNTFAFNTGFGMAQGDIIAETTPETMFTTDIVRKMYEPHLIHDRAFIAFKTWNLGAYQQLDIDNVNWHEDVSNIMKTKDFFVDVKMNNLTNPNFGTHQTCSIKKSVFYELFPKGFPLFGGYGEEDPHYHYKRSAGGVKDITVMQPMCFHQWHPTWEWWTSKGRAPMLNKFGHSMSNYMNDTSGEVPKGGTCELWDNGSHEQMSDDEKSKLAILYDTLVKRTGCTVNF